MGTKKQVGTWGSSTLLGYSTAPYSKNYYRIIEANKQAKKLGISYGKYMSGLWEKHDRIPIDFGNFEKYKKKPKQPKLLEGAEAGDYIRALKSKAGTLEEPEAKVDRKNGKHANAVDYEKAKLLNAEWSKVCKPFREHPEEVKRMQMKMAERKKRWNEK